MSSFKFEFNFENNNSNKNREVKNDNYPGGQHNINTKQKSGDNKRIDPNNTLMNNANDNDSNNVVETKMPLSTIQICHLFNLFMKNKSHVFKQWKTCDVPILSSGCNSRTSSSTYSSHSTLKRIIHTEKPFQNDNNNKHESKSISFTADNTVDNDDSTGISLLVQKNNTDIIPGKYEGGLKVWECSIDLCNFLSEHMAFLRHDNSINITHGDNNSGNMDDFMITTAIQNVLYKGGTIVELGCGHGLPACLLLKEIMDIQQQQKQKKNQKSFSSSLPLVLFTDYNSFVLRDVTLPNILLNCSGIVIDEHFDEKGKGQHMKVLEGVTRLIAGDWMELSKYLQQNGIRISSSSITTTNLEDESNYIINKNSCNEKARFDLILASETTYTLNASKDTAYWLYHHLKEETGIGLVSMKRYYFGVGGSTDAFKEAAFCYGLNVDLIREYNDGSSNIRDLLLVQLPRKNQDNS